MQTVAPSSMRAWLKAPGGFGCFLPVAGSKSSGGTSESAIDQIKLVVAFAVGFACIAHRPFTNPVRRKTKDRSDQKLA